MNWSDVGIALFMLTTLWSFIVCHNEQRDLHRRLTELEDWTRKNGEAGE